MIKFFRRIRQKLLSENKFSKYLIYALGEIILVVIGILIALWINNRNEEKKSIEKEQVLLQEMVRNLQSDSVDLAFNIKENIARIKSNEIILKALESKIPNNDSLDYHFGNLMGNFQLTENTAAWENLKSMGFDVVSNDQLRNNIASLYATKYKYLENLEQRLDDGYQWDHMYPQILKNITINKLWESGLANNYKSLQENREFMEVLKMNIAIREFVQVQYETVNKDVSSLISQIEEHLDIIDE